MYKNFARLCACLVPLLGAGLCLAQPGANKQAEFAAHARKADEYLRDKRPDLAIPELEAAVAINPMDADTQGDLGVLLFLIQGKAAEAIPHLRVAVEKQPSLAKIQGILGIAVGHGREIQNPGWSGAGGIVYRDRRSGSGRGSAGAVEEGGA